MKYITSKVLTDKEIREVHDASLHILEETGIRVFSDKVIKIMAGAGAVVDYNDGIVKFPRSISESCLQGLKDKIQIYNRSQDTPITLGDGKVHCASGHNAVYTQVFDGNEINDATKKDVEQFAFITDALENLEVAGIVVMPNDVCAAASLVHAVDAMFNNTTKHIFFSPGTREEAEAIIDMAKTVAFKFSLAERPILTCQLSPTSPLTWEKGAVEALVYTVQSGVPVSFLPGPLGGATCPYTLAGHLVQYNTELLSGIIISQIVRKGTPVIYGGGWSIFDMRESIAKIATVESALLRIAGIQMSRFYNIPNQSMGFDSDSHCYDEQQGLEKMLTALVDFTAGCDLIVNAGMYSSGVTASLEQLVVDNEIAGILYRMLEGISFGDFSTSVELIKEIGPGGEYLSSEHTVKYLRTQEHRLSELSLRYPLRKWKELQRPDIIGNARNTINSILKRHRVESLSEGIREKISVIINDFEKSFQV